MSAEPAKYIGYDKSGIARVYGAAKQKEAAYTECCCAVIEYVRRHPDTGPVRSWLIEETCRNRSTGEIEYEFEELPLLSEGSAVGGLVNGKATIAYHIDDDGSFEWFVHEIYLDAYRKLPGGRHEQTHIEVEANSQLYLTIWSELTDGSFKQHVSDTVLEKVQAEIAYA